MGKRNFEWSQATIWDGFFTQDKPGGITERVDPETVFARLRAEGFLLDSVDYLVNRLANSRDILWTLDSTGEKLESTLFQVSGLGAQLVPVETDFDWQGVASYGGRGVTPGRVYIGGVDTKVWAVQEARGDLYKSTDNWKTSVRDASLYTARAGYGITFPVVKFVHMDGVSMDAWVCGSDVGTLYVAYHTPTNYNADGTLKPEAWFVAYPPYLVADIGTDGHVACMVGNHGAIMRTTDWLTFSVVYSGGAVLGGIDTDRYGNWIAIERDTGRVLRSVDNGLTWTFPAIYLDDVPVANLPSTGSVTAGNGIWLASGNSAYEYSEDGLRWYSGNNALGSFYGCGFDGARFYASEPNTANPYRLFQLLVSEVPFQRHLSALKGATIKGDTWLVDLPSVSILSTDENGRLQDGESALFTSLESLFVSRTATQTVHGVKDFVDGAAADFLGVQQFVDFGTNPDDNPHQAGRTHWDTMDQTLATDLPNGVTLQHGQELHLLGRNVSGGTLTNGTVVYCSGSQGFRATIDKAEADVAAHSMALAVLTQDVANNGVGYGTAFGLVRDLDTSAFTEGAVLYLSATAGQLTETRPAAPNVGVRVALCVRSHPSAGMLFVSIDRFPTLSELSDVAISSPTTGQVIKYDGVKWVNGNVSGGSSYENLGVNWSPRGIPPVGARPWTFVISDPIHGTVVAFILGESFVDVSMNGFDSYKRVSLPIASNIVAGYFCPQDNSIIGLTPYSGWVKSLDGGYTWTTGSTEFTNIPRSAIFSGIHNAAFAYNNVAFAKSLNGTTFSQILSASSPAAIIVNESTGRIGAFFTSSGNTYVQYSDDGGTTWSTSTTAFSGSAVSGIWSRLANAAIIFTSNKFWRTIDFVSFAGVNCPISGNWYYSCEADTGEIFVIDYSNVYLNVAVSRDGGASFALSPSFAFGPAASAVYPNGITFDTKTKRLIVANGYAGAKFGVFISPPPAHAVVVTLDP